MNVKQCLSQSVWLFPEQIVKQARQRFGKTVTEKQIVQDLNDLVLTGEVERAGSARKKYKLPDAAPTVPVAPVAAVTVPVAPKVTLKKKV
jgi:hypothetical protein